VFTTEFNLPAKIGPGPNIKNMDYNGVFDETAKWKYEEVTREERS